jgi:hypothetical protein
MRTKMKTMKSQMKRTRKRWKKRSQSKEKIGKSKKSEYWLKLNEIGKSSITFQARKLRNQKAILDQRAKGSRKWSRFKEKFKKFKF